MFDSGIASFSSMYCRPSYWRYLKIDRIVEIKTQEYYQQKLRWKELVEIIILIPVAYQRAKLCQGKILKENNC